MPRKRDKRLHLRFSEKEYDLIIKKVNESKLKSASDFVLYCVEEKEINVIEIDDIRKLVRNIANNVNQIAKIANQTGQLNVNKDMQVVKEVTTELWQHLLLIKQGKHPKI